MADRKKGLSDCCRCNNKGSCIRCTCEKAGQAYSNCLLLRRGQCCNRPLSSSGCINDNLHPVSSSPPLCPDYTPNATRSILNNISSPLFQHPGPSEAFSDISNHVTSSAILPTLPFTDPSFVWDSTDSSSFFLSITAAFEEVVHWKGNLFSVLWGYCYFLRNRFVYFMSMPRLLVLKPLLWRL